MRCAELFQHEKVACISRPEYLSHIIAAAKDGTEKLERQGLVTESPDAQGSIFCILDIQVSATR